MLTDDQKKCIEFIREGARLQIRDVIDQHEKKRSEVRDILLRMWELWAPEDIPAVPSEVMRSAMIQIDTDIDNAQNEIMDSHERVIREFLMLEEAQAEAPDPPIHGFTEEKKAAVSQKLRKARSRKPGTTPSPPPSADPARGKLPKSMPASTTQEIVDTVEQMLRDSGGMTSSKLYKKMGIEDNPQRKHRIRRSLDWLLSTGRIRTEGEARGMTYIAV